MRLLVCGDRNWKDVTLIEEWLTTLKPSVVIEGEAAGADTLARVVAERLGIPVKKYPANWDLFGKAAGPMRNIKMLHEGKPDRVLAFHDDIKSSKGTKHMINAARKAGLLVTLVGHDGVYHMIGHGQGFLPRTTNATH